MSYADQAHESHRNLVACCRLFIDGDDSDLVAYLSGLSKTELALLALAATSSVVAFADEYVDGQLEEWVQTFGARLEQQRRTS